MATISCSSHVKKKCSRNIVKILNCKIDMLTIFYKARQARQVFFNGKHKKVITHITVLLVGGVVIS